ncbi:hypothetical protein [Mitsuaria sp. GD03876]|uniref:hypothetical protein n=1 Tax=Mitsuaria sp. GD03876 TaxID=2975399 RepID=UPI0024477DD6|nr:hypothetical protein [Mitsuaria sp. GD03876]MDH0863718.1 hypothetical protein [Mitsuaria sp. GD03876]
MSPQDRIAIATALVLALALHGWAIGLLRHRPAPRAVDAPAVTARLVAATATLPALPSQARAIPVSAMPRPTPVADRRTVDRTARAESVDPAIAPAIDRPVDSRADASAHPPSKTASPAPAGPIPRATPETRPAPPLLALPLQGEGTLAYAFVIDGRPGEATLRFRIDDGRYELTLERRAGDRALPAWHSDGLVGAQGLQPERHRVTRRDRERERLVFDRTSAPPALLVGARAFPLPAGTQDRLSWWLQLSALMAAEPDPHIGLRLRLPVAGPAGVHDWDFEVAERDGDRWLLRRHWSRGPGRPALQWSAWLDRQRGFLPVELRFSLDDEEQWALRLLD